MMQISYHEAQGSGVWSICLMFTLGAAGFLSNLATKQTNKRVKEIQIKPKQKAKQNKTVVLLLFVCLFVCVCKTFFYDTFL